MTTIDFCICTFQRPHIAQTMRSIAAMHLPPETTIRLIIADNDSEPSAQTLVATTAQDCNLSVTYLHAPAGNISIARNACLAAATADYIAFIDDDQIVSEQWLTAALTRAKETKADVILGPVRGVYPQGSPAWLTSGNFHDNLPAFVRGKLITGYTGSTLIRRTSPAFSGLTFNEAYGVTGGEDTDYFTRAHRAGATIAYAPEAAVYEPVPPDRTRLYWLIQRRKRYGQTHAHMLRSLGHPHARALLAGAKAVVCFITMPFCFLNATAWRSWLLRGVFHTSVASTLLQRA